MEAMKTLSRIVIYTALIFCAAVAGTVAMDKVSSPQREVVRDEIIRSESILDHGYSNGMGWGSAGYCLSSDSQGGAEYVPCSPRITRTWPAVHLTKGNK